MKARSEFVRAGDVDFFVERVGAGKPLLICGGPQLGHAYMRALDFLADTYELIYYDARGSGRTELGDPSRLTMAQAVADLEGVCMALGLERFGLFGHSLGGHLAYLYASQHHELLVALVLCDVGPPLDEAQARELGRAMRAKRTSEDDARMEQLQDLDAFARRDPKTVEEVILNIYTPFFRDRASTETVDFGFTDITAANVLDYEDRLVESLAQEDPLTRLAAVSCPTVVMHGEIDPIPADFGKFLASSIPRAQLAIVPGASHFPFIEDRAKFEPTLRAFLTNPG